MGEENKAAESNEQETKKEEAVEEKKEEEPQPPEEVVLRVDMHCEGCARKVEKSLRKLGGVEDVKADSRSKTVIVKGKSAAEEPMKVCEWVQKKTGKRVELVSPIPAPPPEEEKKEEKPAEEQAQEEKKEEPKAITVILKMKIHCEACAQVLQRRIKKIEGVESVETDVANEQVIVKGIVDPNVLVESVYRRTKKQVSIVQEEEKPKEEEKPAEEEKKQESKDGDDVDDPRKYEYWPLSHHVDYAYPPAPFYAPPMYAYPSLAAAHHPAPIYADPLQAHHVYAPPPPMYAYPPPQMFSDENPHSCSLM